MQHTLETVHQLMEHTKLANLEMSIKVSAANLNSTSWTTAAATGALGYMGYPEAKKFAKAYDIQAVLQRTQDDEFRTASSALALMSLTPGGPPALSDDRLRSMEREVLNCLAMALLWGQIASQLSAEYERVLKAAH